jgi:ABC-type branched-subunit amino acid transport system substrate-binding protein
MTSQEGVHSRRRRAIASLLGLVLAGVVAAGCGGDDDDDGGGGGGGEVNVGVLMPLTGPFASFGKDWQQAAELALKDVNAAATMQFNPVVGDDPDPQTGVQNIRKMVSTQDVTVIVGGDSSTMVAVESVAERARVPIISSYAGTTELDPIGGEWLWRTVPSDVDQALVITRFYDTNDVASTAMFVENVASLRSIAAKFEETYTASGGQITEEVEVNPDEASYRAAVGEVLRSNPEWVFCACTGGTGASILKEMSRAGYDGERFVPAEMSTDEIVQAVGGDVMAGTYSYTLASDPDLPAYQRFLAAYEEAYGNEPVPYSASAYDAAVIAALAAIAADSSEGEAIRDKLREVAGPPGVEVDNVRDAVAALEEGRDIDYQGASGPVDLEEAGSAQTSFAILQVEGGKWETTEFYSADDLAETKQETSGG